MSAAPDPPAECTVTLATPGQARVTVESHHMVREGDVWTCLHCPVTRDRYGQPTQPTEET